MTRARRSGLGKGLDALFMDCLLYTSQVEQMRKLESRLLPEDICYEQVRGLRLEAIEKLQRVRPYNIGQASRISGVSPADISVLLIYLSSR